LGKAEEIVIVNNETVKKAAAVNNVGDFQPAFYPLCESISTIQGYAGAFPIEYNVFPGICILHIVARIIQHNTKFFPARRKQNCISWGRETVNLNDGALILRIEGYYIKGMDGRGGKAGHHENEEVQKNNTLPLAVS
jgi:hypothetical protein